MPQGHVLGVLEPTQHLTAKLGDHSGGEGGGGGGRESQLVMAKGAKCCHQERERGFK